jgi:hypothetical protein
MPAKSSCIAARRFQRVGFNHGFGVMVGALWAFEGGLRALIACSKHFKYLLKMAETGEATKSDIDHIDRSGAPLGFRIGLRPAQPASGNLDVCCADAVEPISRRIPIPTCKTGMSL